MVRLSYGIRLIEGSPGQDLVKEISERLRR
jgi:hypothetical protein